MTDFLKQIDEKFPLSKLAANEFETVKVSGMTMHIEHYEATGLGHVSYMVGSGFLGLMKMETLVVTPIHKDLPLFSVDLIHAAGKHTVFVEFYDTLLKPYPTDAFVHVQNQLTHFVDGEKAPESWLTPLLMPGSIKKVGKKELSDAIPSIIHQYTDVYLNAASELPECDANKKRSQCDEYVNGLLEHGGPATDVYLKTYGKEFTETFLKLYMFGTKAN